MKIVKENNIYKIVKIGATCKAILYHKVLTINPTPSDANVTFSKGIISGNTTTVEEGSSVTYSVSKNGYSTYTDTIIVSEDMTINVELQEGYPSGTVLFENSAPGTYNIEIEHDCIIYLNLVGGGGCGYWTARYPNNGGSGGYIYGEMEITKGNYEIIVGDSGAYSKNPQFSGTDSSFANNIAGGGERGYNTRVGNGGSCVVSSSGLTGSNGIAGSTTSRFLSYGGGGSGGTTATTAQSGYCKIVTI